MIRGAQQKSFGEILKCMQRGHTFDDALALVKEECSLSLHHIKKYNPFIDPEGILRVGGRMNYAKGIEDEAKHPAFVPQEHDVTRLFITNQHEKLGHRAGEMVLASLCQDESVQPIGGIRTVRHYLINCFTCKLLRKSRAQQLIASLPSFQVHPKQPVFSSISINYAGSYEGKRGRSVEKQWFCLFTCHVTTAVRIGEVESLETTAFLNASRRFLCLTGNQTSRIRSDCATTFVGARNVMKREMSKIMRKATRSADVQSYLRSNDIAWDFSTSVSWHHQGLIERQIRTFKEESQGILGSNNHKRVPSDFELLKTFREAENIMSCRPLGKHRSDEEDIQLLRPLDLMTRHMEPNGDSLPTWDTEPKDKLRRGHMYTRLL